jgi:hypothetical protein
MDVRSKANVGSRLIAGIADSNPAEGMNICHMPFLWVAYVAVSATSWSLVPSRSKREWVCLIMCDLEDPNSAV